MKKQFKELKQDLIISGFTPKRDDYSSFEERIYGDSFYYLDNGVPDIKKMDCFEKTIEVKSKHLGKIISEIYGGEIDQTLTIKLIIAFPKSDYHHDFLYPNIPELNIFAFGVGGEYHTYPITSISDIEAKLKDFLELKRFNFSKPKQKRTLYAISQGNRVKIGITDNIFVRFRTLQMQSPHKLKLILFSFEIKEVNELEKALHFVFRNQRLHGEWFEFAELQIKNIRSIFTDVYLRSYEKVMESNLTIEDLEICNGLNLMSPFYPLLSIEEQDKIIEIEKG